MGSPTLLSASAFLSSLLLPGCHVLGADERLTPLFTVTGP